MSDDVFAKCGDAMWNMFGTRGTWCVLWRKMWKYGAMLNGVTRYAMLHVTWWCDAMVEMQCGRCGVVWNVVCCRTVVSCVIRWFVEFIFECSDVQGEMLTWCGMVCGDVVEQFDVNYGVMWTVVSCVCKMWCDMECCNFRQRDVEWCDVEHDWNAKTCDVWYGVECCISVVKCGGVEF